LFDVIHSIGRVLDFVEVDYRKNVMASMRWTNQWISETRAENREFLFLIEKNGHACPSRSEG